MTDLIRQMREALALYFEPVTTLIRAVRRRLRGVG